MQTIISIVDGIHDDDTAAQAAQIWKKGGLVAFPTETVYGLGGNGLDPEASKKIYAAKGRPSDNPLILHIAERKQLDQIVKNVDERAVKLMDAFWPGPLTMIFPKADIVPYETTGGLDTVAVRMPSHPFAAKLLREAGIPIAAPSANLSGRPSPTSASHVIEDMNGRIDMIIDGGDVGIGVESTIIDLSGSVPILLRPGFVTMEKMEKILGNIDTDQAVYKMAGPDVHPKAPGMKYRHYAPKADMIIVEGSPEKVAEYINEEAAKLKDKKTGILACDESKALYRYGTVISAGSRKSSASIAHNLFRVLREFDELGVDFIFSEGFSEHEEGLAVMNRLMKAAGHHIVKV